MKGTVIFHLSPFTYNYRFTIPPTYAIILSRWTDGCDSNIEESPNTKGQERRLTAGRGDPKESATEIDYLKLALGKGGKVG